MDSPSEMAMFLLLLAFACLHAVPEIPQRGSVLMLLAIFTAYLTGIILVYISVAPATAVRVSPAAARRLASMACAVACALLLLFAMSLVPFHFFTPGW